MIVIRHDSEFGYPKNPPFNPEEDHPEYPFENHLSTERNRIYSAIRDLFRDLSLDTKNYGSPKWNPLGTWVKRGGKISIKPNWVWDPPYAFEIEESYPATLTHSSLIRAVIDYAYIAVGERGRISVLDSPIEDTNWNRLHKWSGFDEVYRFYKRNTSVPLKLIDIRDLRTIHSKKALRFGKSRLGFAYQQKLRGDPEGYIQFNLGNKSEFSRNEFDGIDLMRSPQRWTGKYVNDYHNHTNHIYSISRSLLDVDLLINMPKLKHHKKAGVTLSLKNFIGSTNKKIGLPHYRLGSPPNGDEHPFFKTWSQKVRFAIANFNIRKLLGISIGYHGDEKRELPCDPSKNPQKCLGKIRFGDWYGADTLWRTILDLNKVVLCGDLEGLVHRQRQRNYLSIIDGVVGGELQSPLHPTPVKANLLLASQDPVALDTAATILMGFDPKKILTLVNAYKITDFAFSCQRPDDTKIVINGDETTLTNFNEFVTFNPQYLTPFQPSSGWKGHIESQTISSSDKTEVIN
jgi:uncharacterized protein (DUF362 family)